MGIICIGNSHVNTFSNMPNLTLEFKNEFFEGRHIGSVIAYNFLEHHFDKVLCIYQSQEISAGSYLTLVAGEVDCRLHIPVHSDKEKISDEEMTFRCINRFFYATKSYYQWV